MRAFTSAAPGRGSDTTTPSTSMWLITAGRTHTEHLVLAAQSSATADLRSDLAPHGSLRLFVPDAMTTMSGVWFSTCERTRSEERRVGKGCVSTCRSWLAPDP